MSTAIEVRDTFTPAKHHIRRLLEDHLRALGYDIEVHEHVILVHEPFQQMEPIR